MASIVADVAPNVAATLIDALIASNRGDRHAFEYARKTYSYQDVAALMNRTGNMIRGLGVEKGQRVLLLLPDSPAFVASMLGATKAGAVPVLGAPVEDVEALERCVAAAMPVAAIVHESHIERVEKALATIAPDNVAIVGANARGYKSFVDAIRVQSSWLAAEPMSGDAPALDIWTGFALATISHADVGRFIGGSGELCAGVPGADTVKLAAMLRSFAKGEEAQLR